MNKDKTEKNEGFSTSVLEKQPLVEVWTTWWDWALPLLVGWIPEVKRLYIQFLCFNSAIQLKRK